MARYRVLALAALVTVLLAVVTLAAHGRPLREGGGSTSARPPAAFYDYAWTTVVIACMVVFAAGIVGLWYLRGEHGPPRPYWLTIRSLLVWCLFALVLSLLARHHLHFRRPLGSGDNGPLAGPSGRHGQTGSSGRLGSQGHNDFQWPELFVVLGLFLAVGVLLYVRQARGVLPTRRDAPQALAAALDESLDDLRADPDLRRAIIAAYARMETALGVAGIPRRPAEAPLEYLERALLSLDASAEAVRRLTDLFEWARFSHHDPDPSMRDDAVDALIAVRDELRASELIPA